MSDIKPVSEKKAVEVGKKLGVDWNKIKLSEFKRGLEVEQEHSDVVGDDLIAIGMIALAHLREYPDYYTRLRKIEK